MISSPHGDGVGGRGGGALSSRCAVCGVPLRGAAAALLAWRGIGRSRRNPNTCTRCGAHLEEGRLVELTVVFADLSGFTAMTGRLGAEKTSEVVDGFLRLASGIVARHGGTVDKFIGDAIMAFFNAPIRRADHAAAAVAAAEELRQAMPGLSGRAGAELRVSVGVATGFARVGRLGSDDLKDYTAIGECVNEAARLQAQARAGEILVGERTYGQIAAAYPGVPPERLALKGFSEPTLGRRLHGAPVAAVHDEAWLRDRPAMDWVAVALAVAGSGCLGKTAALTAALAYGAGSAASLAALARAADGSALRLPLLAAAAALAGLVLASAWVQRRRRAECGGPFVRMTAGERRRAGLAAGLAAATLALAAFELASHQLAAGRAWRGPIAEGLSSALAPLRPAVR